MNVDMPQVSVIVPVYNVEKYIDRCFSSIAQQSFVSIECIFIDDFSPDSSVTILENRIRNYSGGIQFKVVHHEKNRGLSVARNTGIFESTGKYLFFLDSDDELTNDAISLLVEAIKTNERVDIVQGNTKIIGTDGNCINVYENSISSSLIGNKVVRANYYGKYEGRIAVNAWNKLIRKEFIVNNNLYFKDRLIHEDEHWMFFVVKCLESVFFVRDFTYLHYVTPGSIMQNANERKSVEAWLVMLNDFCQNIDTDYAFEETRLVLAGVLCNLSPHRLKGNEKEFLEGFLEIIAKIPSQIKITKSKKFVLQIIKYISPSLFKIRKIRISVFQLLYNIFSKI